MFFLNSIEIKAFDYIWFSDNTQKIKFLEIEKKSVPRHAPSKKNTFISFSENKVCTLANFWSKRVLHND